MSVARLRHADFVERCPFSGTDRKIFTQAEFIRLLCRFSDAGMTRLSTLCGGRRPKGAKARNRGKWGTGGAVGAYGDLAAVR